MRYSTRTLLWFVACCCVGAYCYAVGWKRGWEYVPAEVPPSPPGYAYGVDGHTLIVIEQEKEILRILNKTLGDENGRAPEPTLW